MNQFSDSHTEFVRGLPREARPNEWVAIDTEFFGQDENRLHIPHGKFACLSVSYGSGETFLVEDEKDIKDSIAKISLGHWIMHNAAYDIRQLRRFVDIEQRPVWDTMLVEKGLWSGWYDDFALGDLSRRWLKTPIDKSLRSQFGSSGQMNEDLRVYSSMDALATVLVARAQYAYLMREEISMRHYWEIDEPCMWAIICMPPAQIDVDGWLKLASYHEKVGLQVQKELGINVASAKQVTELLAKNGIYVKGTNKKDVLLPLVRKLVYSNADGAKLVEKIIKARIYRKAASAYGKKWVDENVESGGLIHGDFWTIGARSSRMACSRPNLQNIPTRDLPMFRRLFTSLNGRMLIADAWQQEICVLAQRSGDKELGRALSEKRDLHQETADDFSISRREGKDINLGLGYGMSAQGLATRVGITLEEAERGIERRNERYREVKDWGDRMKHHAMVQDYVETSMGRRLWINRYDYQHDRHAINLPIQGTAAEHTKLWFVLCHRLSKERRIPFRIPLVVHDEIVADVPPSEVNAWSRALTECGTESGSQVLDGFQMTIGVKEGDNWGAKQV